MWDELFSFEVRLYQHHAAQQLADAGAGEVGPEVKPMFIRFVCAEDELLYFPGLA